jgi:hypothetical protein
MESCFLQTYQALVIRAMVHLPVVSYYVYMYSEIELLTLPDALKKTLNGLSELYVR